MMLATIVLCIVYGEGGRLQIKYDWIVLIIIITLYM